MTLGEKISILRRQKGWSQEELADRLDISRQSVSKWESLASIPDLDKIVRLSELFGVTTDQLLKEEFSIEMLPSTNGQDVFEGSDESADIFYGRKSDTRPLRRVSYEEAHAYMDLTRLASAYISLGVSLCILSPICLILLSGASDAGIAFAGLSIHENMAAGIGVTMLFLLIAAAVSLFITYGHRLNKYEYLEKETFTLEPGLSEKISEAKENYAPEFRQKVTIGVILCILSVIPIILAGAFGASDFILLLCTIGIFLILACAVPLFIRTGMVAESYTVLLQTEDYRPEHKTITASISSAYWLLVTAIYLGISFYKGNWHISWIIWPVAAILYGVIENILEAIMKYKSGRQ